VAGLYEEYKGQVGEGEVDFLFFHIPLHLFHVYKKIKNGGLRDPLYITQMVERLQPISSLG